MDSFPNIFTSFTTTFSRLVAFFLCSVLKDGWRTQFTSFTAAFSRLPAFYLCSAPQDGDGDRNLLRLRHPDCTRYFCYELKYVRRLRAARISDGFYFIHYKM
jgi:hypothetical protein